jgi:hypothetical protein
MSMDKNARKLLERSFDTALNSRQQAELDTALATSPTLRAQREALACIRDAASDLAKQGFGPFFSERVMAVVTAESVPRHALTSELLTVFKPVALAALVALAVLAPLGGRALYESVSAQQTLVSVADGAYALDLEEVLCQTE